MNQEPDIEADVTFLTTEQGGRLGPVFPGYSPNHLIKEDYLTSGKHEYPNHEIVELGVTVHACIRFISPEFYPHTLSAGQVISLQEGSHVIGHAKVTRIINKLLSKDSEPNLGGDVAKSAAPQD